MTINMQLKLNMLIMKLESTEAGYLYNDNFSEILFDMKTLEIKESKGKKDGSINMDRIANMAMILSAFEEKELFF